MKICIGHVTIDFVDLLYNKEKDKFLIFLKKKYKTQYIMALIFFIKNSS
jgi:hypothetical protein